MDVYDQDIGPDDMNAKLEADVKIEVESDDEGEDGDNIVNATRAAKSVKKEIVKSGFFFIFLVVQSDTP